MAEFVVSPILRVLSEKLASAVVIDRATTPSLVHTLFGKLNLSNHNRELLNRELQKLLSTVLKLEPLIVVGEIHLVEMKGSLMNLVTTWLKEVKCAAFEVHDVLDELFLFSSSSYSMVHEVSQSSLSTIPIFSRVLSRIKSRRTTFDVVLSLMDKVRSSLGELDEQSGNIIIHHQTTPILIESNIYGREDDKEKIVDMLISSIEEDLSIISVVGMGGLGKTTLAQLVFNDRSVVYHFEVRVWIHVGQVFDEAKIVQEILQSVKGERCKFEQMSLMAVQLMEILSGRRFLIVLDDIWNENGERWDSLIDLLQRTSGIGCKIVVTTRSVEVARMINESSVYHLGFLSDEDCGELILAHASCSERTGEETPELLAKGRTFVEKCKGLPLAAKFLGSVLQNRQGRERSFWDGPISGFPEYEAYVLDSLKVSYNHLPSHLKQCFAYCSIFPKGFTIKKENLIQLWIAEDFIQSSDRKISLEEIGNDYFLKLLWMSFFQPAKQDVCGNTIECTMHDCVHDLAQSIGKSGSTIFEAGEIEKTSDAVHYSSLICSSTLTEFPRSLCNAKSLRTLLMFSASKDFMRVPNDIFLSFRCLRVLDMSRTATKKLPVSVCMLIHLRYLDLSHTSIETLPKSFSSLKNLQTLKLSECYRLLELPKDLETMVNLRHLDISQCCSMSHLPSGLGQLTCLQTLPMFIVGLDKQCSLRELRRLKLKGKLEIKNLKHVGSFVDADEANLKEKLNLHSLGLSWGHEHIEDLDRSEGCVLERLQPHSNLRELSITGCKTVYFPEWMGNLLNLVKISITDFKLCNYLPSLGQLPHLKYLYIKGMDAIECINYEFYGDGSVSVFPSLEEIEIYNMPNLEEWLTLPERADAFPHLIKLTVKGCPSLTRLPLLPVLSYLALWDSNERLLSSLDNQTSLSSLVINEFQNLITLPDEIGNLSSLKKLTVYNCNNLVSVLEDECIQWLTSVEHLSILYCKDLRYLSAKPRHLVFLRRLYIIHCPQLSYLPELVELISLQALTIDGCPKLASLPYGMHRMVSLQELRIKRCPNLEYLPMGFEHVTSLLYLEIGGCNLLQIRLQRDGQDWHKIAHIPTVSITRE